MASAISKIILLFWLLPFSFIFLISIWAAFKKKSINSSINKKNGAKNTEEILNILKERLSGSELSSVEGLISRGNILLGAVTQKMIANTKVADSSSRFRSPQKSRPIRRSSVQRYGRITILDKRKKYVQIALNGSASEALRIISMLPSDLDRILIEAGTPLIKSAGIGIISDIRDNLLLRSNLSGFRHRPYIVADMKVTDLADREVMMARHAGASAITCLGVSPVETINNFIASCRKNKLDSMVDMMNVDNPIMVLKQLREQPDVVIVHRGVDETDIDKQKMIPYYQINQIKGNSESMVAVAGGDTIQEIRSALFNNADIVVLWKAFVSPTGETADIIKEFLKEIR